MNLRLDISVEGSVSSHHRNRREDMVIYSILRGDWCQGPAG